MLLNEFQVKQFLPHRPPFLFVDRVIDIEVTPGVNLDNATAKDLEGTLVTSEFTIREDLEILEGHFPGNPILPGVIQVEMMAQTSAFVSLPLTGYSVDGVNVETLLVSVDGAKFRKPLVPGMTVQIIAKLERVRGLMAYYSCVIEHEGDKTSEANILAKLTIHKKD
jgi:3-hydroxyacyl-[acyl-carrier-protein] dehydratase